MLLHKLLLLRGQRLDGGGIQSGEIGRESLSTVFISRLERGKESPSVDNLVRTAKALGRRVRDLVSEFDSSAGLGYPKMRGRSLSDLDIGLPEDEWRASGLARRDFFFCRRVESCDS